MPNKYLSDKTIELIQFAYYHENENALIYKRIASWLKQGGFENLAEYFTDWAKEEIGHGEHVRAFMDSLDIFVPNGSIKLELNIEGIGSISDAIVNTEDITTNLYKDLTEIALDMDDLGSGMLLSFSQEMAKEQIEETDKALTLAKQLSNMGGNLALLQLFDNSFEG